LTKLEGPKPLQAFYQKKEKAEKSTKKERIGRRARLSTTPSSLFKKQRKRQKNRLSPG
jgi:hypothetical protein